MISKLELDKTIPVNPPTVNKKIKPRNHSNKGCLIRLFPKIVAIHLKILIEVGIAITIVAAVK